jgi:ketopantoate hydroxymethyltransferase
MQNVFSLIEKIAGKGVFVLGHLGVTESSLMIPEAEAPSMV